MDCELQTVALDQIDLADSTFQISTSHDKANLTPSIQTVGLLQPPIVLPQPGRMTVVCGFRRIAACRDLRYSHVPVWRLQADQSMADCARIAIVDNACQRELNLVEQARALALMHDTADETDSWLKIAERYGLPVSQSAQNRILPLADMAPPLQEAVVRRHIALPVALRIHGMQSDDSKALTAFFISVTAGLNVQRELLEYIEDISRRDRISIAALIRNPDVVAIVADAEISGPQRVQQLRRYFKEKRYPELTRAERRYQDMITKLHLHPRLQLQPPPFFEGSTYRLLYAFKSRNQLKTLQTELERLIHQSRIFPE